MVRAGFQQARRSLYLVRNYLILTTCTYARRLFERIGHESRRLFEVVSRCLVVQNSPESQVFVENLARGAERPQKPRSPGDVGIGHPARRLRPTGARGGTMGAYAGRGEPVLCFGRGGPINSSKSRRAHVTHVASRPTNCLRWTRIPHSVRHRPSTDFFEFSLL